MALVSQQLADLRQGRAGAEKLGGKAVPEDMGPMVGVATDTGALQSGLGTRSACIVGVAVDRRARLDVWRHRHPRSLPPLGTNEHLAQSPVDIIQVKGGDLVSPQAELRQQPTLGASVRRNSRRHDDAPSAEAVDRAGRPGGAEAFAVGVPP